MVSNRIIAIAILLLIVSSCTDNSCSDVANINVSELLIVSSNEQSYNYCELLTKAVKKDAKSVKMLSLLEFSDAVGYDHGSVIVDLILLIGEETYIDAIKDITPKEKSIIEAYVDVGLEYGNNQALKGQSLKVTFPILYSFLNDK